MELAWGFAAGDVRTMLVRPADHWPLSAWDKGLEGTYRLPLQDLLTEGKTPLDCCLILNAALGGSDVFVGSPETDSMWLFKLYKAAGVDPNFRLQPLAGAPALSGRAEERLAQLREAAGCVQTA